MMTSHRRQRTIELGALLCIWLFAVDLEARQALRYVGGEAIQSAGSNPPGPEAGAPPGANPTGPEAGAAQSTEIPGAEPGSRKPLDRGHPADLKHEVPINVLSFGSKEDLQAVFGVSEKEAQQIIKGRPYRQVSDLKTKHVISQKEYAAIRKRIKENAQKPGSEHQ